MLYAALKGPLFHGNVSTPSFFHSLLEGSEGAGDDLVISCDSRRSRNLNRKDD